ncbi:hypothetical protein D3C78_795860 [compost metagenome]
MVVNFFNIQQTYCLVLNRYAKKPLNILIIINVFQFLNKLVIRITLMTENRCLLLA